MSHDLMSYDLKQLLCKSSYVSDRRHPTEVAKDYGLVPFESNSRLLMLDLDKPENEAVFDRNFALLVRTIPGIEGPFKTTSKSGKKHAYVKIPRMSVMERLCLQAALGSDPMRELLGFLRAKGYRNDRVPQSPIWLFETPTEAAKVEQNLGLLPGRRESFLSQLLGSIMWGIYNYAGAALLFVLMGVCVAVLASAIND